MCHQVPHAVFFSSLSRSIHGVYFGALIRQSAKGNGLRFCKLFAPSPVKKSDIGRKTYPNPRKFSLLPEARHRHILAAIAIVQRRPEMFRSSLWRRVMKFSRRVFLCGLAVLACAPIGAASAQEKIRLAHSALESSNSVWYVAKDRGLYKKYG